MASAEVVPLSSSSTAPAVGRRWRLREIHLADRLFYLTLKGAAWGIVALLVAIFLVLLVMAWPTFKNFGWHFFVETDWDTVNENYGALALIFGTLVTSFLALLLAVPVAVGTALFLNELAPRWLATPITFFVEMLAAIPSIVYGLWGLFVLAPFLRTEVQPVLARYLGWIPLFSGPALGVGILAAGVVLAIMIVPTIASISKEVFRSIPASYREAALGLGATRWETIRLAVLKTGASGILGAVILGLGRALGETMAVTMVIGNRIEIQKSLFAPAQTMASLLANQYAEAENNSHLSALTAIGLSLLLVSMIVNSVARFIIWRVDVGAGKPSL